jgi:hypothetical protein
MADLPGGDAAERHKPAHQKWLITKTSVTGLIL